MTHRAEDISPRTAARVAGAGLLAMAVLALFADFYVLERLVVVGDAATTVANIGDNEGLFRLGTAGFLIVAILDVVVALALYVFLKPVSERLAMLAAALRLAYAAILGIALVNLAQASALIGGDEYRAVLEPNRLHAQVMLFLDAFDYGWRRVGLVFFGLHLLVLGYLILKSDYVPSLLSVLLMAAAAGYLTDSFANILLPNYADYETAFLLIVAIPALIGELSLTFWLLFRGGDVLPRADTDLVPARV